MAKSLGSKALPQRARLPRLRLGRGQPPGSTCQMARSTQLGPVCGVAVQAGPRAAALAQGGRPAHVALHYAAQNGIFHITGAALAHNDAPTL